MPVVTRITLTVDIDAEASQVLQEELGEVKLAVASTLTEWGHAFVIRKENVQELVT